MIKRRSALLLGFMLALSGCGFKLKGLYEVPEPLKQLVLIEQSTEPTALGRELIAQFAQSGIILSDQAPYRLELDQVRYNRRALTLSSRAEALEYELSAQVSFSLYQGDLATPVLERRVNAARSFEDNSNSIALESLETRYRDELNRALADQIIRQYLSYAPAN